MKKRNLEEVHDGFPTNGIKYETKDLNYRNESMTNKELQKEVKSLQKLLEKVKCCEDVLNLTKLPWVMIFEWIQLTVKPLSDERFLRFLLIGAKEGF